MASSSDTMTLNQINEKGNFVRCLFQGRLIDITIHSVRGIYYIELEAISHTYSMDLERKTRSFQNQNMTYMQMIQSILKSYPKSDFIDNATKDSKLGKFVLQYQETDWQFLKRMASHFGAVLVPDSTAEAPKFWLGMQVGKKQQLSEHQYRVKKDLSVYIDTIENSAASHLQENDFLTYIIESKQSLSLGDRVTVKGNEMMVFQSIATMKQGTLTYEYLLSRKEGIRKSVFYNEKLTGATLQGEVIDIAKDTVRIHLDIDPEQKKDEASWFTYSTVYSAEGHTGFYSMPELGDTVQIYFPNRNEANAIAVSSIRQGGDTNPKTADPSTKL